MTQQDWPWEDGTHRWLFYYSTHEVVVHARDTFCLASPSFQNLPSPVLSTLVPTDHSPADLRSLIAGDGLPVGHFEAALVIAEDEDTFKLESTSRDDVYCVMDNADLIAELAQSSCLWSGEGWILGP